MVWGDKPIDTTATAEFERLDRTMSFAVVGDEDLADSPAEKHQAAHRRPRRGLTLRGTVAAASALFAGVFVAGLAFSGSDSPDTTSVRQAAPEASMEAPSPKPTAKPKRPPVRPAEPVVLRSARPAPAAVRVTITVTAKTTPTLKPSSPSLTKSATPSPTSSGIPGVPVTTDPETTPPAPDEAQTTSTETPDDDS